MVLHLGAGAARGDHGRGDLSVGSTLRTLLLIGGTVVASYTAFSRQCGLYLQAGALAEHAEEVAAAGLKATKAGITFTPSKPIPDALVEKLVRASREDAGV